MYFPYLRGKQFELLALRELAPILGAQGKTVPIIEPVRSPEGSGLGRCIDVIRSAAIDFVLVANPTVGRLASGGLAEDIANYIRATDDTLEWNVGLIVNNSTSLPDLLAQVDSQLTNARRITLIYKGLPGNADAILAATSGFRREFDVFDDNLRRQLRSLLNSSQGVTLHDWFEGEARNADFLQRPEKMFSDDHLYFEAEGYYGFGDYLTIGEPFTDGGFSPRAVVIHWTYEREHGGPIMIRHFTSESNTDIGDVGGKFLEALQKLVTFLDVEHVPDTRAAGVLRQHLDSSTYPGLGVIKKLSTQNHLELVSSILSR